MGYKRRLRGLTSQDKGTVKSGKSAQRFKVGLLSKEKKRAMTSCGILEAVVDNSNAYTTTLLLPTL